MVKSPAESIFSKYQIAPIALAIFVALFHVPCFRMLANHWQRDANWIHGFLVFPLALYALWSQRKQLISANNTPNRIGPLLMLVGMGLHAIASFSTMPVLFLQGWTMLLTFAGALLSLGGFPLLRLATFPLILCLTAIPAPGFVWYPLVELLQGFSAKLATILLQLFAPMMDYSINRAGNTLELTSSQGSHPLNVAEACSGIRMAMTFVLMSLLLGWLGNKPIWKRVLFVALALPCAVIVNAGRVTALGLLSVNHPEWMQGQAHLGVGMLMLLPGAGLLLGVEWILDKLFLETPDAPPLSNQQGQSEQDLDQARVSTSQTNHTNTLTWKPLLAGSIPLLLLGTIWAILLQQALQHDWDNLTAMQRGLPFGLACVFGGGMFIYWRSRKVNRSQLRTWMTSCITGIVIGGTLGLQGALIATGSHLIKTRIELRAPLSSLPSSLGPWQLVYQEPPLDAETQETLGTDQYITLWYVNSDITGPQTCVHNKDDWRALSRTFPPSSLIRLHLTYYSPISRGSHTPDKCFVGGGARTISLTFHPIKLTTKDIAPAQHFSYFPVNSNNPNGVMYFFVGPHGLHPGVNHVMTHGLRLSDQTAFFAKVEIQPAGVPPEQVPALANDFLQHAWSEIRSLFPREIDVK